MRPARFNALACSIAAAAAVAFFQAPDRPSRVNAAETIENATTLTWKTTTYRSEKGKDSTAKWKVVTRADGAWRAPSRYRETRLDPDGEVRTIEIADRDANKTLVLDPKRKTAAWREQPVSQYGPGNPFASQIKILKGEMDDNGLELIGQRDYDGAAANVFRYLPKSKEGIQGRSLDFWVDASNKNLVRLRMPGGDHFDPDAEAVAEKPRGPGIEFDHFVAGADLDPKLFEFTIPEGFTEVGAPPALTEDQFAEWLKTVADVNGGLFGDDRQGLTREQYQEIANKPEEKQTNAEKMLTALNKQYSGARQMMPPGLFQLTATEPDTFRYIGKGAKLGDAARIICWYRLKGSERYRAIYGDLTIKEIAQKDLPLPNGE